MPDRASADDRSGDDPRRGGATALDGPIPGLPMALAGELEDEIGASLDLVIANRAPPDLVHRVMRDGVLLLDRAPGQRIAFEVAARNRWFDLQPVLATYRSPTGTGHGRR